MVIRQTRMLRVLRRLGAGLATATAVGYLLIGVGLITPAGRPARAPIFAAAIVFGLGAYLLAEFEVRVMWLLGAAIQAVALVAYVTLAGSRDPAFEPWGVALAVMQAGLLVVLLVISELTAAANRRHQPIT